ncbi:hypothetical protein CHU98_g10557 [Xylaria longipes]|nr:hypothetical protein CHU98_g10557 [Xylaria longipes]
MSRDQGHTDLPSYTICANRTANAEFFEQETCWDHQSELHIRLWIEALQIGDIISILPRAIFPARVNIIRETSIKLQYEAYDEGQNKTPTVEHKDKGFYNRSLKANEHEIRILVVEPGSFDGPIHFPIFCLTPTIISAAGVPWAGRKFAVGRNVETGLRRLRQEDKTIRIWIDAICINQIDFEERAQQVSIMSLIYSYATTVHIWLGEGNLVVDTALRVVHELANFAYVLVLAPSYIIAQTMVFSRVGVE